MACGSCGKRIVTNRTVATVNKKKVVTGTISNQPPIDNTKPNVSPKPVYYRKKK